MEFCVNDFDFLSVLEKKNGPICLWIIAETGLIVLHINVNGRVYVFPACLIGLLISTYRFNCAAFYLVVVVWLIEAHKGNENAFLLGDNVSYKTKTEAPVEKIAIQL